MHIYRAVLGTMFAAVVFGSIDPTATPAQTVRTGGAKLTTGCVVGYPKMGPSPSFSVTVSQYQCYKQGHTIDTGVRYSYKQADYSGAQCGTPTIGHKGPGFTPKLNDVYYLWANFTVFPLLASSGVRSKSTGWKLLVMARGQHQCGKLDQSSPPASQKVCGYPFVATDGTCGSLVLDNNYQGPALPQFSGQPMIIGTTVYSAPIASPSGSCQERLGNTPYKMMGFTVRFGVWTCPGGIVIDPQVTVYYYPPGGNALCVGSGVPASAGYTIGQANTATDERFTSFKLPSDFTDWGGRIAIINKALIRNNNGNTPQVHGVYTTVAHEYASMFRDLKGTVDGCSELGGFAR